MSLDIEIEFQVGNQTCIPFVTSILGPGTVSGTAESLQTSQTSEGLSPSSDSSQEPQPSNSGFSIIRPTSFTITSLSGSPAEIYGTVVLQGTLTIVVDLTVITLEDLDGATVTLFEFSDLQGNFELLSSPLVLYRVPYTSRCL